MIKIVYVVIGTLVDASDYFLLVRVLVNGLKVAPSSESSSTTTAGAFFLPLARVAAFAFGDA